MRDVLLNQTYDLIAFRDERVHGVDGLNDILRMNDAMYDMLP